MSGTRMPIISKRAFNFDNGSATVVAVKAVDVTNWREGTLLVRVHESGVASSSTLKVEAYITAPSQEEPSVDFVGTTAKATCTLDSSSSAGDLEVAALSDDFGAYLQINVVGTQSGGNCNATISAELVLKT